MNKPDSEGENPTNDGEGTVIAILDNEFFFRAPNSDEEAFKHETFTELVPKVLDIEGGGSGRLPSAYQEVCWQNRNFPA